MEIYDYINSEDVKKYLKKIKYQFTPLQAAWIISRSDKITLNRKHRAWRRLIKTMPDQEITGRLDRPYQKSLHRVLEEIIELDKKIARSFKYDKNCSYKFGYWCSKEIEYINDEREFSTFKECLEKAKETAERDFDIIKIKKTRQLRFSERSYMFFSKDGHAKRNCGNLKLYELEKCIYGEWFKIPIPFKRGDIVCSYDQQEEAAHYSYIEAPFVFIGICPKPYEIIKYATSYEMLPDGIFCDDHGVVYRDVSLCNYIDLEYYKGEQSPRHKVLELVSEILSKDK